PGSRRLSRRVRQNLRNEPGSKQGSSEVPQIEYHSRSTEKRCLHGAEEGQEGHSEEDRIDVPPERCGRGPLDAHHGREQYLFQQFQLMQQLFLVQRLRQFLRRGRFLTAGHTAAPTMKHPWGRPCFSSEKGEEGCLPPSRRGGYRDIEIVELGVVAGSAVPVADELHLAVGVGDPGRTH